jgi:hypothetical protein
MAISQELVHLAGATLGEHRHICAFLHSADEEYQVLLPFIKEGLRRGEKAYHIVDPELSEEHRRQLHAAGIDVPATEQSGQLELHHWLEVYLQDGRFERDRMLRCVSEVIEQGQRPGYPQTRTAGHAEWTGLRERRATPSASPAQSG